MKYTTLKTLVMLCLLVILTAASVSAQSNSRIRVNIPFDFTAGKARLKAGEYILQSSSKDILVLRRIDNRIDTFVLAPNTIQRSERSLSRKVVFHRYGNEYFLAQAWTNRDTIGKSMKEPDAERRLARQLAKVKVEGELVEVTAALK